MPICVYDIHPDGSATTPTDSDLTGPGVYRWWHFDLTEPGFADWARGHIDPIPAAALLQSETRPRCDRYDAGLILNLRGINLNAGQPTEQMVSVRMWCAQDVIVTARVRRVFALDAIRQNIADQNPPASVAAFLDDLVGRLTQRVQEEVLEIAETTGEFEDSIAENHTDLPPDLGDVRRSVIKLRRYLEPQRAALQKLATTDVPFLSDDDRLSLREIANRSTLAVEELDALRDRMATLQDHHDTQAALQQGRNGYALSVVAAIFLPLGFLTGLFGVNVGGMPGISSDWAFLVLSLLMIAVAVLMVIFMRWMRWL